MPRILLAALLVFAALTPAAARMHAPYRGHRIIPANAAPLDGLTSPSGAYSFRKLRSAYAGPAIRLRRASDSAELDINFLGCTGFTGCPWDSAAATTHCAATTCSVVKWYDQSGFGRDLVQATAGAQPPLVLSCNGTLPCVQTSAAGHSLATVANTTPATGVASLNAVANRAVGTAQCVLLRQNGTGASQRLNTSSTANGWVVAATSVLGATASDAAWHVGIGIANGAGSQLVIDGTATAGTVGAGTTTPGLTQLIGTAATTCNEAELVIWDNYVLTAGEQAALQANQKSFWGTP